MRAVDLSSHNLDDGKDGREEEDNVLLRSGDLDLDLGEEGWTGSDQPETHPTRRNETRGVT
jgi:hypothetical protein